MEAKSTTPHLVGKLRFRSSHTTLWCGSCVWKWMWSACADFYHSSHAYYTLPLWASTSSTQLCVVYLYLQIHSLTHVLTYSWRHGPLCLASLLGLGPAGLELATARLHTAPAARHPPPPCCARPPQRLILMQINSLTSGAEI